MKKTILLFWAIFISLSSQAQSWNIGDKVQVQSSAMDKWENATISAVLTDRTPTMYKARLDRTGVYADDNPLLRSDQIRSANAKAPAKLPLNSRVDLYYPGGGPHTRGSITQILPDGRYKVKIDGCSDKWDEIVDWSQVKPAPYISTSHPDIAAVIGKWAMFTPSYPTTVTRGNDIYRQYGTGAKAPPLQINANGTFIWYNQFNKPPIKATWIQDAKVEGLTSGVESFNGIIINDGFSYYKVYRDRPDHIICERLCWGTTDMGTRIK